VSFCVGRFFLGQLECDDVYDIMKRYNYHERLLERQRVRHSFANKKVPDLMKDENNGIIMTEFVGLREKMYALRVEGKKDMKKAKGIKSNVVAKSITFEDYTQCLNDAIEMTRRLSCIRSNCTR